MDDRESTYVPCTASNPATNFDLFSVLLSLLWAKIKPFKCVNCGEPAEALYKSYGPTLLKLTKCDKCGGIVDKYVEYDPVIIMIDLVLVSREAQRHVIYNTQFQHYWKLFIILMIAEAYGVWRSDITLSVISYGLWGNLTQTTNNTQLPSKPVQAPIPAKWRANCWTLPRKEDEDDDDLFIWERDFYIQCTATFTGIAVFLVVTYVLMKLFASRSEVSILTSLKSFSLSNGSLVFWIPPLVWGSPGSSGSHYLLVSLYCVLVQFTVYTVVYRRSKLWTLAVLVAGYLAKFQTTSHVTAYIRGLN